ncbi:hypothetical protein SAMN05428988_1301 [Chitinophaga sp. YR573]|uniref:hypothetical protein n=1 Tax=Chitinophaga sp. YR573 TaxID=1881040 RepID=UPI0008ACB05E|nr:hypothetical protein [Chitinophaga sp. YR573]SEW01812.1 hypothetical protein SAMN05428988_1301 [Chitinophaga sp. YR573]
MNKKIDFSQAGGLYIYEDTLDFLQTAYSLPIDAVISAIGDKIILSGVVDQGANTSAGWITYNGEALPFLGGLKAPYIIIENIAESEQFDDAQQRSVYSTRRAKFGNVVGVLGGFAFAELKPFPFKGASINSSLNTIQTVLKSIINFEDAVILDGCIVSNVVGADMEVSAGIIMFSGNVVISPAYNGAFPAYLNELGVWSTDIPVTGLYVKFDPYTSQRYKDVMRRFNHQSGEIIMSRVLSDRFDAVTGIGKWEWLGFKLSSSMRGRAPVGYWFGANGAVNLYDAGYRVMGTIGGFNTTVLTVGNLAPHTHPWDTPESTDALGGTNYVASSNSPSGSGRNSLHSAVGTTGEGDPFDNRQPFEIVAYIETI